MSNPSKAPVTPIFFQDDVPPDAYYTASPDQCEYAKVAKRPETIRAMLDGLDMTMSPTFVIPKALTVDPRVLQSTKPVMGSAKNGKISLRVRSGHAHEATRAMFRLLPHGGPGNRHLVRAAMLNKVHADGGSEYALGRIRKYYPKKDSIIVNPPTRSEAEGALFRSGAFIRHLPKYVTMPFPLLSTETERGVKANPHSDNGFPVLGQFGQPEAQTKCMALAVSVRRDIVSAFKSAGGVWAWVRQQERGRPWLITFRGKAKGDYYAQEKLDANMLRFYNALPRQIMLNMQVATQSLEKLKKSILTDVRFHSCSGVALVHGGADRLVGRLDEQLTTTGCGYAHMGDDSWVAIRTGDRLVMFALDCSSFDLTQHSEATKQVHQVVREQLAAIDAPAADLWWSLARQRNVVVAGATVRTWKHAGPSGMPLQSVVNCILMDVLIERAIAGIRGLERNRLPTTEGAINGLLKIVGQEVGFVIKVEQYRSTPLQTVRNALTDPFLFIGYDFWRAEHGSTILPYCDIARTMAQMPYPGLKWLDKDMLDATEAMRLGSIAMSAGIPPPAHFPAHQALVDVALRKLVRAKEKYGDIADDRLQWAVQMSAVGPDMAPSLSGLYHALVRGTYALWAYPLPTESTTRADEEELPSSSIMTWAEQTDEEEEADRAAAGQRIPVAYSLPDAYPLVGELGLRIKTHPVTERNDGRPGPTAEWLPNRAKQPRLRARALAPYANRIRSVLGEEEDEGDEVDYDLYPAHDEAELRQYVEDPGKAAKEFGEEDSDAESAYYGSDDDESVLSEDEFRRRMGTY